MMWNAGNSFFTTPSAVSNNYLRSSIGSSNDGLLANLEIITSAVRIPSMSLILSFCPLIHLQKPFAKSPVSWPPKSKFARTHKLTGVRSYAGCHDRAVPEKPGWEKFLSTAASLYPIYVTAGGVVACVKPSVFSWFVERAPFSYTCALGFIMLAMGLTLELKEFLGVFKQRLFSILFGCLAQYTMMPAFGAIVSKALGLQASLSVGLILLGCCPGGTASNVVTLIAQGDVPLSIVMTVCTTLAAVLFTPLLTKILAGAYIPVDAAKLSISTLQVVVAPILLGSYMQSTFPSSVKFITPFAPLLAVLVSSFLASSVFSENVVRLKVSVIDMSMSVDQGILCGLHRSLFGELGVIMFSVFLLHFAGFFVGYLVAAIGGFQEKQRRAISIEVGMQNSSLGVVLATSNFSSPLVALPPALSAVIMNIMGSSLGFLWRYIEPEEDKAKPHSISGRPPSRCDSWRNFDK